MSKEPWSKLDHLEGRKDHLLTRDRLDPRVIRKRDAQGEHVYLETSSKLGSYRAHFVRRSSHQDYPILVTQHMEHYDADSGVVKRYAFEFGKPNMPILMQSVVIAGGLAKTYAHGMGNIRLLGLYRNDKQKSHEACLSIILNQRSDKNRKFFGRYRDATGELLIARDRVHVLRDGSKESVVSLEEGKDLAMIDEFRMIDTDLASRVVFSRKNPFGEIERYEARVGAVVQSNPIYALFRDKVQLTKSNFYTGLPGNPLPS